MKKILSSKKSVWLLLVIAAAICCIYWALLLPSWVSWQEKEFTSDAGIECHLKRKKVTLTDRDGNLLWTNKKELKIQDAFITDIDRNGDEELILLLWKRGRYGNEKPFWVTGDEISYSQHIFIYDISEDGDIDSKWFASDIGRLVTRMKLLERDEAIILTEDRNNDNTLWIWSSFGLKNIDNEVKFAAFGDNIIHKSLYEYAYTNKHGDFSFLYEPFIKEIESADIASIQAETILVDKPSAVSGYPQFGSPIEVGEAIKNAGFDIAVCGNNHALDKGIYGIDVTTSFYKNNDITCIGIQGSSDKAYRPYEIISKNGIRIALFSYTYGTNGMDMSEKYPYAVHYIPKTEKEKEQCVNDIQDAKKEADFIVVYAHWGDEYTKSISDDQREFAYLLCDAGVDVVIGTHPHVLQYVQTLEREDGGETLVYYSLGNFRADQKQDEATRLGGEAYFTIEHTFDGIRIKDYELKEIDAVVQRK
ncbi:MULTISPECIES: CapA family protein [unclassified Butyrivibrio]|uniref:CapA family protein n=1 Tax=unclassified Butyrivibrio TaxID=2639466 RepID=UPI0003B42375|nr:MULTISPECIES: CapA family protein [unclassified Butyrivibrio]